MSKINTWTFRISLGFIVLITVLSLLAPWLAPYGFDEQNVNLKYQAPSLLHIFGTDALGRDLFSRLLFGGQVSMTIALITAVSSVLLGTVIGTLAGFFGGIFDKIVMRFIDILYTIPSLIVILLIMLLFGNGLVGIFLAITVTAWLGTARLMRAQVLSWKHRPFVEAGRALGMGNFRLLSRHILPNCIAPLIIELSYQIPTIVLSEAFLSFLGVGIRPPTPSWGSLAQDGWQSLRFFPHLSLFPGLVIFFTMLSFNLMGDYLRDKLDPFLKGR